MLSDRKRQHNLNALGSRIKDARTKEGYTQKAFADALGLEYYTMISQMELGYISIPPSLWTPIADKLRMDRAEWVLLCLLEIQPEVYSALFGNKPMVEVSEFLKRLDKGGETPE
jgi:DNA-binding XRE family transcriptional regulator